MTAEDDAKKALRDCEPFLLQKDDAKLSPTRGAEVLGYIAWKHRATIRTALQSAAQPAQGGDYVMVPREPTNEMIAAACLRSLPMPNAEEIERVGPAVDIMLRSIDMIPGMTKSHAMGIVSTMVPVYKALIAAAPKRALTGHSVDVESIKEAAWDFINSNAGEFASITVLKNKNKHLHKFIDYLLERGLLRGEGEK